MNIVEASSLPAAELKLRFKAFAPGRINLIGEHTDYNGGKVLPFAMDLGIGMELLCSQAEGARADTVYELISDEHPGLLRVKRRDLVPLIAHLAKDDHSADLRPLLPEAIARSWARYAIGVLVWHLKESQEHPLRERSPHLIQIHLTSHLPSGAGISSSAALTTGLLSLLARYEGLPTPPQTLARQAMWVEHQFAGTRCGLMDQTAVALAEKNRLLLIDFRDLAAKGEVATRSVALHARFSSYRPVLINTKVKHELGDSPYNERRRSCEEGLLRLRSVTKLTHPSLGYFAQDKAFLAAYAPGDSQAAMIERLTREVFAGDRRTAQRIAHAILENVRVDQAVTALESGDLALLTKAINGSHESLRDDYEVSCRELDLIRRQALDVATRIARDKKLTESPILGSRMTGGGFGGSTIQLVHSQILGEFTAAMAATDSPYVHETGLVPGVMITEFAAGLSVEQI